MNISYLFSLPLLTKELIEQAQHRRTYLLRVIYAIVLYSLALWQYNTVTGGGVTAFANLGRGREFFWELVNAQILAILLLLPAITCGALTVEKEKDTLALLLLTKLSPWTIVFEKLLSRVFAMGTYQLLSLPLFGIVQSMGGVEVWEIVAAVLGLFSLSIAVASISILCSTWFRTTSEAFIMSYLALFCLSCVLAPAVIGIAQRQEANAILLTGDEPTAVFEQLVVPVTLGMMTLGMSGLILWIASSVLVMRAFIPAWNVVLYLFQQADRFFNELNTRTTGGIVLVQDRDPLPLFRPIAWRETRKKSLGTFRYQFRVLMLLLSPLILAIAAVIADTRMESSSPFQVFPAFFWFVSVICLTIHSTGVIPAERIRQSLDVLLVAPLSPRELVMEKLSGVRRMIKVLSIPFVVLIGFQLIWTGYVHFGTTVVRPTNFWVEFASASLSVVVYMPLIMWIGFQFGLRMKTQIQAVLCTLALITAACLVPLLGASIIDSTLYGDIYYQGMSNRGILAMLVASFSPLTAIFMATPMMNRGAFDVGIDLQQVMLTVNFTFYLFSWFALRRNALRTFSRIVGRLEPDFRHPPDTK